MDELKINKTIDLNLIKLANTTYLENHKIYDTKLINNDLKLLEPLENGELDEKIITIRNDILDFIRFPAPYLNVSLKLQKLYNRTIADIKIKFKNITNILKYLNHDYILINKILSNLNYYVENNYNNLYKYTNITTPIYKSKSLKLNKIKLFDYQINNIESFTKLTSNEIVIRHSDTVINLQQTDEEPDLYPRQIFFDNYNIKFTFEDTFLKFKSNGVILADEMGLGKTITMISYIKSLPPIKPNEETLQAQGQLIIVPSHLANQWVGEIKKVWKEAKIKTIFSKREHLKTITRDILLYDFVIVTQQFLINKNHYLKYPDTPCTPRTFNINNKLNKFKNNDNSLKIYKLLNFPPLFELITWNNIILDEAHEIMNLSFGNSITICRILQTIINKLKSNKKWYISGTPYNNKIALKNICNYLQIKINQNGHFIDWDKSRYKNIIYTKNFLEKIVLRHTKKQVENQLKLKGLEEKVYWLTQTQTEKQIYQGSINKGRNYLLKLCCHLMVADFNSSIKIQTINIEDVKKNIIKQSKNKITKYTESLKSLDPTNQSYHMVKANYNKIISQAKFMLESITNLSLSDNKNDDEDQECSICIDDIIEPTLLPCGHIFCYECIQEVTQIKKICPLCKEQISSDLIKVSKKTPKKEESSLINKYGVKTGTLIKLVRQIIANPDNNIIIFSQYDFMLKLISDSLSKNGVTNSFVKGSIFQRNKAIESFKGLRMDHKNQVIMLSLKNAASGTHLVEANHIIFVDPVDSYKENVLDIENQAIARAFRIGQNRKVYIHRLLIKNTIEEEIYNKVYL